VSVFLRWGIFGIIAVAALVYAFNASKDLAARRTASAPAAAGAPAAPATVTAVEPIREYTQEEREGLPPECLVELTVARRAVMARDAEEPLDRLLRIQEIAWLEDRKRRERLERIATHWYAQIGPVDPLAMRKEVLTGCLNAVT
jgi:hypothetical protein